MLHPNMWNFTLFQRSLVKIYEIPKRVYRTIYCLLFTVYFIVELNVPPVVSCLVQDRDDRFQFSLHPTLDSKRTRCTFRAETPLQAARVENWPGVRHIA